MNPHAVNLAVLAGQGDREDKVFDLNYGVFHGTAFCLAPHLFLTAAHVFRDAQADGDVALASADEIPPRSTDEVLPLLSRAGMAIPVEASGEPRRSEGPEVELRALED